MAIINNLLNFRYVLMLTFTQYFQYLNIQYALKQVCLSLESYRIKFTGQCPASC